MCASILGFQAPLLRAIAAQLHLPPIAEIARLPGTREVYRITVQYFDGRACNSVATLRESLGNNIALEVVYQRALLSKPLRHTIDDAHYTAFVKALKGISFDRLSDQPDLPAYNSTDLWLIERAAGSIFYHCVIIAPELAKYDAYGKMRNAVKNGLPEALRQVK